MLTFDQEKKAQEAIEALLPVTAWNPVVVTQSATESNSSSVAFTTQDSADIFVEYMASKNVVFPNMIRVSPEHYVVANFALVSVFDL